MVINVVKQFSCCSLMKSKPLTALGKEGVTQATPERFKANKPRNVFWEIECKEKPSSISCIMYEI